MEQENRSVIIQYDFDDKGREAVARKKEGKNWPVVYLIHNNSTMYIGETQNIYNRFEQHLKNKKRNSLEKIEIIFDEKFNKSAILDIEQSLIQLYTADKRFTLQNIQPGQSEKHNYYQREKYLDKIDYIWEDLHKRKLTNMSIADVRNTDLFKYSPYTTLTSEQNEVSTKILYDIMDKAGSPKKGTSIITGGAGTGKTIVLINMIFKLVNANNFNVDFIDDDEDLTDGLKLVKDLKAFIAKLGRVPKIGYVVPMTSIRQTLKKVFSETKKGLLSNMVIGPFDPVHEDYDILFVDEAHRLAQYKNISFMGEFKKNAIELGKDPNEITQLDMLMLKSKYQVLVYDSNQTVKGSDITHEQFLKALSEEGNEVKEFSLTSQMRCKGGDSYTEYINDIFECKKGLVYKEIDYGYDFRIFDDVDNMVQSIKELDKKYGLCRNAAGYAWPWISKKCKTYQEVIDKHLEDIHIGTYRYVWNMKSKEFILSENAINEIGCIHTLQGYDLNYVGVIFGKEIDYDSIENRIVVDPKKLYDENVKRSVDENTVRTFILNSYKVIMERGIRGCYVYVCNKNLRDYFKKFIKE